ncbi:MAG TPA: DivIVA domain-containing protein [Clostridiaceae bacterium]|nr:DivIVA domain-containing protein [Clostridiaceae bacterium]
MNFLPNDLQNIAFKKSMMGYNILQVEDVLLKVVEDLSELIKENAKLKEKLEDSQDKVKYYKTIENNLHNSLIIAQQTSEEIVANARDNADNIVKEAELKAQQIIDEAHKQVLNVKFEYENLKRDVISYKAKIESIIKAQLMVMDGFEDEEKTVDKEAV